MRTTLFALAMTGMLAFGGCNSASDTNRDGKTFDTNDSAQLRQALCGKSWYAVLDKEAQGVTVFVFNRDCTVLNEGTEDEAPITIQGNKMSYVGNNANYTEFVADYDTYILAYNQYAGLARAKAWFYRDRKKAEDFLNKQ